MKKVCILALVSTIGAFNNVVAHEKLEASLTSPAMGAVLLDHFSNEGFIEKGRGNGVNTYPLNLIDTPLKSYPNKGDKDSDPANKEESLAYEKPSITSKKYIAARTHLQNMLPATGDFTVYGHLYGKSMDQQYSNLYKFGGLYFTWDSDTYGTNTHHSIRSTYGDTYGDNITLNSFNHVRFNIDANNNNGSSYFEVGEHTTGTGNILFRLESPTGNVGIGTTTLSEKLTVNGNISLGIDNATVTSGYGNRLRFLGASLNSDELSIARYNKGSNASEMHVRIGDDNSATDKFVIGINDHALTGTWVPKFTVQANGNVGLGTETPASRLHVIEGGGVLRTKDNGDGMVLTSFDVAKSIGLSSSSAGNYGGSGSVGLKLTGGDINFYANGGLMSVIKNNGSVGIGTSTPNANAKLHVNGDIFGESSLRFTNSTAMKGVIWGSPIWEKFYSRIDDYDGQLRIMTDDNFYLTDIDADTGLPGNVTLYANTNSGNVGIGTTAPGTFKLAVAGDVKAKKVQVTLDGWSDFVFEENFELLNLAELEAFIKANKHLPNVPSEAEVLEKGIDLGAMDATLLQKIEELTLYTIEQEKQLNSQKDQLRKKDEEVKSLEERLARLEQLILSKE